MSELAHLKAPASSRLAFGRGEAVDLTIFISSNVLDRPEYRRPVLELCEREGLWPLIVEGRSVSPAEAIRQSIQEIEKASIYLGIFSHIDGHGPTEQDRMRIDLECSRARMRALPRLVFIGREGNQEQLAAAESEASRRWLSSVGGDFNLEFFSSVHELRIGLGKALALLRTQLAQATQRSGRLPAPPRDALTEALSVFDSLVDERRYEQAFEHFEASLYESMCLRWSFCDEAAACLERLFPGGLSIPPTLRTDHQRLSARWILAYCYLYSGRPVQSSALWQSILDPPAYSSLDLCSRIRAWHNLSESRVDDPEAAERAAREGLQLAQGVGGAELGSSLTRLAVLMSHRGHYLRAFSLFRRAASCSFENDKEHDVGLYVEFAAHALRTGHVDMAVGLARHAHELGLGKKLARPAARILNLQSAIAEVQGDFESAIERALSALEALRQMSYRSEEIRCLLGLARLHEKTGDIELAEGFLADLWPLVEQGPYPADRGRGLAILARLELRQGRGEAAGQAAREAFELAGVAPFCNPRLKAEASRTLERLGIEAVIDDSV